MRLMGARRECRVRGGVGRRLKPRLAGAAAPRSLPSEAGTIPEPRPRRRPSRPAGLRGAASAAGLLVRQGGLRLAPGGGRYGAVRGAPAVLSPIDGLGGV